MPASLQVLEERINSARKCTALEVASFHWRFDTQEAHFIQLPKEITFLLNKQY